jgi:hypothetical protein
MLEYFLVGRLNATPAAWQSELMGRHRTCTAFPSMKYFENEIAVAEDNIPTSPFNEQIKQPAHSGFSIDARLPSPWLRSV